MRIYDTPLGTMYVPTIVPLVPEEYPLTNNDFSEIKLLLESYAEMIGYA